MTGRDLRRDAVRAGLPAMVLACALAAPVQAASWLDRLPADDPGLTAGRPAATAVQPALPRPETMPAAPPASAPAPVAPAAAAPAGGGVFSSIYNAGATVVGLPVKVGQAVWELSYMFGFNHTPVRAPVVVDAVPDMADPAAGGRAAPAAAPVMVATAAPPPLPAEQRPPPVAVPPPAPASAPGDDEIDPGLLANFVYDRGERRPDGSFFVPKTLQRLFKVRTVTRVAGRGAGDHQPARPYRAERRIPMAMSRPSLAWPVRAARCRPAGARRQGGQGAVARLRLAGGGRGRPLAGPPPGGAPDHRHPGGDREPRNHQAVQLRAVP